MAEIRIDSDNLEQISRMTVALLSELIVLRDRVAVMEILLEQAGALSARQIDAFIPDETQKAALIVNADQIAASVIAAALASEDRTVADVLGQAVSGPFEAKRSR